MRAFIYVRVSTKQQKVAGDGITLQLRACEEKVQQLAVTTCLVFVDAAVSGDTLFHKRPALSRALRLMQPGDIFIVHRRDRIARNMLLAAQFDELLRQRDVKLICVTEEIDLLQDLHKTDLYAQYQREKFVATTRKALAFKAAQNSCIGTIPYGFKRSEESKSLEVCKQEQAVIILVQNLKSKGYSLRAIVYELEERNYTSRAQTPFKISQVHKILKSNPVLQVIETKKKRVLAYGLEYGKDGKSIQICHEEQSVIDFCKKLREQKLTYKQITHELEKHSYKNRADGVFSVSQVARIIARKKTPTQEQSSKRGKAPYGFKYSTDKVIEVHQQEQNVLGLARYLRSQGYSLAAIARELTVFGHRTRTGNFFTPSNLSRKLKNIQNVTVTKTKAPVDLPYGFKYNGNRVIPCSREQVVIMLVKELYTKGLSLRRITQELEKQGYKTRTGKQLYPAQIARILKRASENKSPYQPLPMENTYETTS